MEQPPLPSKRHYWPWILLFLTGLCVAGAVYRFGRSRVPGISGSIQEWSGLEQKQALALYLNRSVRSPGFQAETVAVARKQNYWSLARDAKVNIDSIVGFNPDMQHLNAYIGRPVLLGNQRGALHQVAVGETLPGLEELYNLPRGTLRQVNVVGWLGLRPGQVLFVPGVAPKQLTPEMQAIFAQRNFFRSPLAGKYTSLLGTRHDPFTGVTKHHNGVDIKAPFNSLVAAAADGTVSLAGWNGGFGKCVIIEHAQGYRTLYGHMNTILVKPGQKVKQYQFIGRVGTTGRTTGPHLHFTIWKDGLIQNPLKYLW